MLYIYIYIYMKSHLEFSDILLSIYFNSIDLLNDNYLVVAVETNSRWFREGIIRRKHLWFYTIFSAFSKDNFGNRKRFRLYSRVIFHFGSNAIINLARRRNNSIERILHSILEILLSLRPRIESASFLERVSLFESPISFDFFEGRGKKRGTAGGQACAVSDRVK